MEARKAHYHPLDATQKVDGRRIEVGDRIDGNDVTDDPATRTWAQVPDHLVNRLYEESQVRIIVRPTKQPS